MERKERKEEKSASPVSVASVKASSEEEGFLLHDLCSNPPAKQWFGFADLLERCALAVALHYYLLFTKPVAYSTYTLNYNQIWYYKIPGLLMTLCLPVLPVLLMAIVAVEEVRSVWKANWMTDCPGATFYAKPDGVLTNLLWQWWLNLGMYSSCFLIVGDSTAGVRATWQDDEGTNKAFWFGKGAECGARYPLKVCDWDGAGLKMHVDVAEKPRLKFILKIIDSYLGIGDKIVQFGAEGAGSSGAGAGSGEVTVVRDVAELEALLRAEPMYAGKPVVGTEFVEASPRFGVHQGDVLTLRLPDGRVHVLRAMYWGDCTGQTSHSSTSAYLVDWRTETITAPARWYAPSFNQPGTPTGLTGAHFPRFREAAEKCVQMHANMPEHPWLNVIGWDTMCTADDEPQVFFEGNFAGSRFRRHCFSSPRILFEFVKLLAPFRPFGVSVVA
eukprot:g5890.t1